MTVVLNILKPVTIADKNKICGKKRQSSAGSTIRPMDTKKTAENIDLSGSTNPSRRCRTSLDDPSSPTRNAPRASEKSNL